MVRQIVYYFLFSNHCHASNIRFNNSFLFNILNHVFNDDGKKSISNKTSIHTNKTAPSWERFWCFFYNKGLDRLIIHDLHDIQGSRLTALCACINIVNLTIMLMCCTIFSHTTNVYHIGVIAINVQLIITISHI